MNKSAFLKLIQQVSNISDQQTEELEKVAIAFPYCQTAHLLLAKSAYDKGSMLSTQRLRRASSYATDRQLLKRIIYTAQVPAPEYEAPEENGIIEEEAIPVNIPEEEETVDVVPQAEAVVTVAIQDEALAPEEETLEEVYAVGTMASNATDEGMVLASEEDEDEEELDSELALLFTFNSISSSSTDLFGSKGLPDEAQKVTEQIIANHSQEAEEALAEIAVETIELPVAAAAESPLAEESTPVVEAEAEPEEEEGTLDEETADPENAEINYSLDEIDRLYAEDALGYWMGSSRMGEVLQLKDDYTRQRPQSFHPELILEYSKTHELEKAIQPGQHVLSHQLDIIDQFLKLNPRLKTMANMKLKPEPQEDLSLKSSKIKKGMASENLANIFLKQGKTKKAVKIYEQLILKYPEKKSYFAEQIEKLQNLT